MEKGYYGEFMPHIYKKVLKIANKLFESVGEVRLC
jgi:hypothetical protein